MIEYAKAVAIKAAGTAGVTFISGFASEELILNTTKTGWETGASTAVVGAIVSVVIPALQRIAAKAAATKVPDFQ